MIINRKNSGFTLIELLVVFSIIGILSTVSIASFANYGKEQQINSGATNLKSILQVAKSRTLNQVKPSSCTSTERLHGYEVRICGLSASSCITQNTFELYVSCGTSKDFISRHKLPETISFDEQGTTTNVLLFKVLSGGVDGSGQIKLVDNGDRSKTVTVTNNGNISIE